MTESSSDTIRSFCESYGIVIPSGFQRRPAKRWAMIRVDFESPRLVAATFASRSDAQLYLRRELQYSELAVGSALPLVALDSKKGSLHPITPACTISDTRLDTLPGRKSAAERDVPVNPRANVVGVHKIAARNTMKIRRQVYELTLDDLAQFPIWEFALDEEGEDGQDEATVRPWKSGVPLDPNAGMFVVRAAFTLADGSEYVGYLTPPVQGESSIGTTQPIIVTDQGQVMFWCGAFPPTTEAIRSAYGKLGRNAEDVFPCNYASAVTIATGPITGQMNGFMHYRSLDDRTIVSVT